MYVTHTNSESSRDINDYEEEPLNVGAGYTNENMGDITPIPSPQVIDKQNSISFDDHWILGFVVVLFFVLRFFYCFIVLLF